jgi:autotransporter passenger strand-loop-strand repeat protein
MSTTSVTSGETSTGLDVSGGDTLFVYSGGTVIDTTVNSGGYAVISLGGNASGTILSGGSQTVYYGGTTTGTIVSSGGFEVVSNGGTTSATTVSSGGFDVVSYGGDTEDAVLSVGGVELVMVGAYADGTIVSGGTLIALPRSIVTNTDNDGTVISTGVVTYQSNLGGSLSASTVAADTTLVTGAVQFVLLGGTAMGTVVSSGGIEYVYSGGKTRGAIVSSGGFFTVSNGGVARDTTVSAGGSEVVSYGGSTTDDAVGSSGFEVVSNGGVALDITIDSGGLEEVNLGTTKATTVDSGGTEEVFAGTASSTTVSAGGLEEVLYGATVGTTVSSGGTEEVLYGNATGTIISSGGYEVVSNGGKTAGTILSAGGLLELLYGSVASGSIDFSGAGGTLQIDAAAAVPATTTVISGFTTGDVIDFDFVTYSVTDSYSVSGDIVTVSAGGGTHKLAIQGAVAGKFKLEAAPGNSSLELAVCYLRGTRILTPTGEVAVETLAIGDRVMTRFQAIQRVKWIGRQSYAAQFVKTNRDQIPVCIQAHALGDHQPARDLHVSPGHSLLIGNTLVLAKALVNGITITQDHVPDRIDYFQIEFETHDCVVAEGTWAESYADVEGQRARFHNAAEFEDLYPDYRPPEELCPCAPRPERGPKLDAALRSAVARASVGLTPGTLIGSIDNVIAPWKVEGWAQDCAHPELPVLLEILLSDRVIGAVLACDYRADLQTAGLGQGRCAFYFTSPVKILPSLAPSVVVRRALDGASLAMSAACAATIAAKPPGAASGAGTLSMVA